MADFHIPLVARGEVIEDYEVTYEDRSSAGRTFLTPDVNKYINKLVTTRPDTLMDLYTISIEDIYDYLDELGKRLDLDTNPYWREAFEISCYASNMSKPVLENCYRTIYSMFEKDFVRDMVETKIGSEFLEGWVPRKLYDGRTIEVRAIGSRSVHVIAGNVPVVAAATVVRSAVTRNDAIIKAPSNDPLTATAIARTMIDMAPDHPLTKHLTVAYWKGGDEALEQKIYQSHNIEKICAWGGFSSIKHISKYLGPGIDLVTLDPKNSTTLIGKEAFQDEETMLELAARLAVDIGGFDQEACVNSRIMFIETGTDAKGIELANQFGQMVFDALQDLPTTISNCPRSFNPELKSEIEAIRPLTDFYKVITDSNRRIEQTGAIIVSQMDEQVDFPRLLYGRVGNLVPLDNIEQAVSYFSAATQTVGIYPPALRKRLRDRAALMGGQMFQPVGYAVAGTLLAPQDGIEPERRMCRWVVDNLCDPADVPAPWLKASRAAVA